ncbi:unnamed protein product, partial [Effrenium voratum]
RRGLELRAASAAEPAARGGDSRAQCALPPHCQRSQEADLGARLPEQHPGGQARTGGARLAKAAATPGRGGQRQHRGLGAAAPAAPRQSAAGA